METNKTYIGLLFDFSSILQEIRHLRDLSKEFLTPDSPSVLVDLENNLRSFKDSAKPDCVWQISLKRPVRTIHSQGEYEVCGRKGKNVYATLSFRWDIRKADKNHAKNHSKLFLLNGIASTSIVHG